MITFNKYLKDYEKTIKEDYFDQALIGLDKYIKSPNIVDFVVYGIMKDQIVLTDNKSSALILNKSDLINVLVYFNKLDDEVCINMTKPFDEIEKMELTNIKRIEPDITGKIIDIEPDNSNSENLLHRGAHVYIPEESKILRPYNKRVFDSIGDILGYEDIVYKTTLDASACLMESSKGKAYILGINNKSRR